MHAYRHTGIQTYTHTGIQTYRHADTHKHKHTHTHSHLGRYETKHTCFRVCSLNRRRDFSFTEVGSLTAGRLRRAVDRSWLLLLVLLRESSICVSWAYNRLIIHMSQISVEAKLQERSQQWQQSLRLLRDGHYLGPFVERIIQPSQGAANLRFCVSSPYDSTHPFPVLATLQSKPYTIL